MGREKSRCNACVGYICIMWGIGRQKSRLLYALVGSNCYGHGSGKSRGFSGRSEGVRDFSDGAV